MNHIHLRAFRTRALPTVVGALLLPLTVLGQTTNTWTNTVTGNWNTASNWTPGLPVNSTNTILQFTASGGTTYRATNNFAGTFLLNRLQFNSTSTNTIFSVGNAIQFSAGAAGGPELSQDGSGAVVVSNAITLATNLLVTGNGSGSLSLNGIISGAFNLTKRGSHLLVLNGANTFGTSNTIVSIEEGGVSLNATARFGSAGRVFVSSNALLQFTGTFTHARPIVMNAGGARIEVSGTNILTQSGLLGTNNAESFTKTGTGILVVTSGNSNRLGQTTVEAGILQADNANAFGTNRLTNVINVNGGTLAWNVGNQSSNTINLNGGRLAAVGANRAFNGLLNVASNSTLTLGDARNATTNRNITINGLFTGTGNLNVTASTSAFGATLLMTNTNILFSGTMRLGSNVNAIVAYTNLYYAGDSNFELERGSTLSLRNNGQRIVGVSTNLTNFSLVFSNSVTVNGDAVLDSRRAVTTIGAATNFTVLNALTVNSNSTLTFSNADFFRFRFMGPVTLNGTSTFAQVTNTFVELAGPVVDGVNPGRLIKTGDGTLNLSNLNVRTYSGGTVISNGQITSDGGTNAFNTNFINTPVGTGPVTLAGGALTVRSDVNITPGNDLTIASASNSTLTVNRVTAAGGTAKVITFGGLNLGTNFFSLAGGNSYLARFTNTLTYAGTLLITNAGADLILDGLLSNTAPTTDRFTKFGGNRIFLTNLVNQPYTGGTFLNLGQIRVAGDTNVTTPLGTGPITMRTNTSLEFRSDTNQVFGPGNGYDITGIGPISLNVDRRTTNGINNIFQINSVNAGTNPVTVTSGNGAFLAIQSPMTLSNHTFWGGGNVRFNSTITLAGSNTLNGTFRFQSNIVFSGTQVFNVPTNAVIAGFLSETTPGSSLVKYGGATLLLTNLVNHNFSGGTYVNAGALQIAASGANNLPVGTNHIWLTNGGLNLRAPGNQTFGPGVGYTVFAQSNSTINVDRNTGANVNGILSIGRLIHNGGALTVSGGNTFNLRVAGPTVLDGLSTFNVTATRAVNAFSLLLDGTISEATPGAMLRFTGGQNLGYTNLASPTHSGGTFVDSGAVIWRPATNAPTGVYRFGTGPIVVNGGINSSFAFQQTANNGYTLSNDFIAAARSQNGAGIFNNGGGTLDFTGQFGARPLVTNAGTVTLAGPLFVTAGTAGNNTYNTVLSPLTFMGNAIVANGDQRLIISGSGSGTGNRIVFNSAFSTDGPTRNLLITANNGAGVEFGGDNSGFAGVFEVQPAMTGGTNGRVLFTHPNAIPGGGVRLMPGAFAALTTNFTGAALSNGISRFSFLPFAVLGLAGTVVDPIDLSPAGINTDARLGASEGFTATLLGQVTPFGDTFKLGGGAGTLSLAGTNILRDGVGAHRLNVNVLPFASQYGNNAAPGTTTIGSSNTFTGGTVVNGGTLNFTSGRINTPLGTGTVETYSLLQATGGNGSFANTAGLGNNNVLITHPGSEVRLDNAGSLNTNRFGDNAPLTLNGAILRHIGRNSSNILSPETVGDITFAQGSQITVSASGTGGTSSRLTLNSLVRDGAGTLYLNRGGVFGSNAQLLVNLAPAVSNGIVAPYIINNTDAAFIDYGPGGFTNATFSSNDLFSAGLNDVVSFTTNSPTTLSNAVTVYALKSSQSLTATGASNLTIRSGGIIFASTPTNTGMNLIFGEAGEGEALLYVQGGATARLSNSTLTASSVTKFGDGTLRLETGSAYANGWNLNRGTVALGAVGQGGLGLTTPGNFINLNGNATLQFAAINSNITYTGGAITSYDVNTLVTDFGGQSDRVQTFASGLNLNSLSNGALGSQLIVRQSGSRNIFNIAGPTVLNADTHLNLVNTTFAQTGGSNRFVLAGGLHGTNRTLTKYGSGTLVLPGNNAATFSGAINVVGGVLSVGHTGSLGGVGSATTIQPGAVLELGANLSNFFPTATLVQLPGSAERWTGQYNRFSTGFGVPETYVLPAGVHLQVMSSITGSTNKFIRLNGGTIEAYNLQDDTRAAFVTLTTNLNIELGANSFIGQSGVDIGRNGMVLSNFASILEVGGSRSLTKIGLDIVVLAGRTNQWTGGTFVNGGTLRIGRDDALPTSTRLAVTNYATFDLFGFNQTVGGLVGNGFVTNSVNNRTLTVINQISNHFAGQLLGTMNFNKQGFGPLTLSGQSSINGTIQIYEGTVYIGADSKFGVSPLGLPSTPISLNAIAGDASLLTAGPFTVPQPIAANLLFTGFKYIGGATADHSRFTGPITLLDNLNITAAGGGRVDVEGVIVESGGNFSIAKNGPGVASLSGANLYRNGTSVQEGTLLVNNATGSGTGLGPVSVNGGATLGGSGRIAGNTLIFEGGHVRPGDGLGRLSFDATLTFESLTSVAFELGGSLAGINHDAIAAAHVDLAGSLILSLTNNYLPATNTLWTLISFNTSNAGLFDNATNGTRLATTENFGSFKVSYGSTNVTLSAFQYTDTGGDGVFDAWAFKHFGLLNLPNGFGSTQLYGDYDEDGASNYAEFLAGTIPTDAISIFRVTTVAIPGAGAFAVRFTLPDEAGFRTQIYKVQWSGDLANWTTINTPVINFPAAGVGEWIDDGTLTGGTPPLNLSGPRFYRVIVQ